MIFSQKEVAILDLISKQSSISQRELAKLTGYSLGIINVILQKFIKSGHIKVSHPNKRKMEYFLTPAGREETTKKNFCLATATIRNYKLIRDKLAELLKELHTSGYDYFSIYGDGDLRELLEKTFRDCLEESPVTLGNEHLNNPRAVTLNVTMESVVPQIKGDMVSVLERIGV